MSSHTAIMKSAFTYAANTKSLMRDRFRERFRLTARPVIMRDRHSFRFIRYPWDLIDNSALMISGYNDDFGALDLLVREGDVVIDVGANIGSYACYFSRLVGAKGIVHSFEPVLDTYWQLRENLVLNRCINVIPCRMALGEYDGECEIHAFDRGHSAFSGRGSGDFGRHKPLESEVAPVRRLDTICSEQCISHVDVLKIDVEGFELEVLQGARGLLESGAIGIVMFEVSAAQLQRSGHTAADVFSLLDDVGYRAYRFDSSSARFDGPIAGSDEFFANYFCTKGDLQSRQ